MKIQYVYLLGDIHGEWESFNRFINKRIRGDKTIVNDIKNGHDLEHLIFFMLHLDQYTFFLITLKLCFVEGRLQVQIKHVEFLE